MASFYGTAEEVNHFLMPFIRNLVQRMTKAAKQRSGGACEHCGRGDVTLEAAHVHGRDRKAIVGKALEKYRAGNGYHIGDLSVFEQELAAAHEPISETFLFLCHDCHMAYDAIARPVGPDELETAQPNLGGIAKAESPAKKAYRTRRGGGTLPIELIPAGKKDFNDAFLTTRKAEIREIHEDGSIHIEPWIATKYTSGSDPINNLRTKTRYRQGAWQDLGIVELVVEVVE